jgi:FecR-like protein
MNPASDPRLKLSSRGALMAVISAALANPALANTGRVDFTTGNVNVTHGNGRVQPLAKGAELASGDKVVTGVDGRAQVRFSDGAYVSLQPNSEFDIKEYRYNGRADGSESAIFGLFKGAMRTVTGIVGRINRSKYQITTPTATIGIRGTGGLIQVANDGSTLVTGTSGIWSLSNNGGTLNVPAGTAGYAGSNRNVAPQPADQGPVVPPPQPTTTQDQTLFVQGNNVTTTGAPAGLVLISGPGYELAGVAPIGAVSPLLPTGLHPANAVFDGSGALTSFNDGTSTFTLAGAQNEFGTNGILAWGRWTGVVNQTTAGVTTPFTIGATDGLHYVIGMATTSMPTSGTFTYNLIGATAPTTQLASVAPGVLNSATLVGNFSTGGLNLNMSLTSGGTTFGTAITGTITSSTFSAGGAATVTTPGTLSCSGGCTIGVQGFFAGAGATQAGLVYQMLGVLQGGTGTTIVGTAALSR